MYRGGGGTGDARRRPYRYQFVFNTGDAGRRPYNAAINSLAAAAPARLAPIVDAEGP